MDEVEYVDENEYFVYQNASSLLAHPKVAAQTKQIGGKWKLDELNAIFPRKRHIEFYFVLVNEENKCFGGNAKIDRESRKISGVELRDI